MQMLYLGGGCFWGLEELFRSQLGVLQTETGYCGGSNQNPGYDNHPGHAEALKISFDESKTDVAHLLDFFFRVHDPTTINRQGNDAGSAYRSVIFYQNLDQKQIARMMINLVNDSKRWPRPVVTSLEPFKAFYPAEDYHQDYLQKNPNGYTCHFIRFQEPFLKPNRRP